MDLSVMRSPELIVSFPKSVPEEKLFSESRAVLVVGHPGHELCVYGWLQLARPRVFILTDGSGRSGSSRLDSTTRILSQVYAQPASIYGRLTDQAVYNAILNANLQLFIELGEELADALVREQIHYVVGDAMEGYNPTHDVCRLVLNAAVELAQQRNRQRIANFEFPLAASPVFRKTQEDQAISVELDETTFAKKLAAANAYPELAPEVKSAVALRGMDAFKIERLRPADNRNLERKFLKEPPFYERHGARQVEAGYYERVIRYRDHFLPLSHAFQDHVIKSS
jgi:hypothetical protein